jgi:hypothetical protein
VSAMPIPARAAELDVFAVAVTTTTSEFRCASASRLPPFPV